MKKNIKKQKRDGAINRRTFLKIGGAAGGAMLVSGFPHVLHAQPKEILIGNLHPLTGGIALTGNMMKAGAELAVEEINRSGGIKSLGGAKLKMLSADTQAKPEVGVAEAERLIRAGVIATFGCYNSSVTFAVTQIHEKFEVPFLVSLAIAEDILKRGFKYTFRASPDSLLTAREIIGLIPKLAKETGTQLKTIALLYEDTLHGVTMSNNAKKYLSGAGLELIADLSYNWQTADLSTEVTKLRSAKPDVIGTTQYLPDTILFARTMKELRCNCKCLIGIAGGGLANPNFAREAGASGEYMMCGINWPNPIHPRTVDLNKKFKEKTGNKITEEGGYGYMTVFVLKDALERASSVDKKAVRNALAQTKLADHILPQEKPIIFDETGQNINAGILFTQVQKGELYSVYPSRYAEKKLIFPFPKWEDRA